MFTASHSCYANKIIDYLDPEKTLINHRLFRDNCITSTDKFHVKDLRILANRELKDVILVDNQLYSYSF